jgi:hypothetical protein
VRVLPELKRVIDAGRGEDFARPVDTTAFPGYSFAIG